MKQEKIFIYLYIYTHNLKNKTHSLHLCVPEGHQAREGQAGGRFPLSSRNKPWFPSGHAPLLVSAPHSSPGRPGESCLMVVVVMVECGGWVILSDCPGFRLPPTSNPHCLGCWKSCLCTSFPRAQWHCVGNLDLTMKRVFTLQKWQKPPSGLSRTLGGSRDRCFNKSCRWFWHTLKCTLGRTSLGLGRTMQTHRWEGQAQG